MLENEQQLYDKFVEVLNDKLDNEPTAQDLSVVLNFLKYNNIQASSKHKGVNELTNKSKTLLPFDDDEDDELPQIRRIK